jgi:hypothetical protein
VGARLHAPVQTGPGAHPASCTVVAGSFPWVKWLVLDINDLRPSRAVVKEMVEIVLYSPSMLLWPVKGELCLSLLNTNFYMRVNIIPYLSQGLLFDQYCV